MRGLGLGRIHIPLVIVGLVYAWASVIVATRQAGEEEKGMITLRIGHWQLEASVREALNEAAQDYQKLHPGVRIIQDAIPEGTYGQWVTTQLMGGTAPDMMEVWLGLHWQLWIAYLHRYFLPLSDVVGRPNPYNAGTPLDQVSFRHTYKDGMRGSYVDQLQEFMTIPLSQHGVRIFYNKNLLKALTGLEEGPKGYRKFLEACETIKASRDPQGRPYTAIAGSAYHVQMWNSMMFDPLTYPAISEMDFNRDGTVASDEHFAAFRAGLMSLDHPAYRARFRMFREVTDYFQEGYTGLSRDEAVFLFAQQKAVFMTTGTWDFRGLEEQAKGRFEIGVMDFPMPSRDDPDYGPVILGPNYERAEGGGFPIGIVKTSKHPEEALDFLLYLASRTGNEKFNRTIGWIPAIQETQMDAKLKAFEPHVQGVFNVMDFRIGGNTTVRYEQDFALYQVKQVDYEGFKSRFEPYYKTESLKDFMEVQRVWRRNIRNGEQYLAGIRALALEAAPGEAEKSWLKYRALTSARQVLPEIAHNRLMRIVEKGKPR